jgi:hypothetical protein
VFYGCQKNLDTSDPSVLNNPTSSVANPLTVDMVQTWFESNYGKSKTISYPHPQTNSLSGDSTQHDFYFNQIFDITPTWTQAEISTYLSVNSIVIVPVKPIPFLDAKKQEYVFVCFRNELNQIDGRLQVYQPTYAYKKSHQTYDVQDFSGFMLQICLNGKVKRIFSYENGKFLTQIIALPNPNLGGSNLNGRSVICKGCYTDDPTSTWWHDVYCWFCELGSGTGDTGGANRLGETGENSLSTVGSSLDYGNNNVWPTNGTNTGSSTSGGSGLSLSAQITNGLFNTRAVVIAKLLEAGYTNNELSDMSTPALKALLTTWAKYEGAGFSPAEYSALRADEVLFGQVDGFFSNNLYDNDLMESFKEDFNSSEIEFEPESWGYPVNHPVTQAIKGFNSYIWRAFIGANNFSTIGFHKHARGEGEPLAYGKSIGAIGEGIFAKRLSDEAGFSTFITQNSKKGGYQHDALQRTVCFKLNSGSVQTTFVLKANFTNEDGETQSSDVWTFGNRNRRISVGKISYEVKTVDETSSSFNLIKAFKAGVTQVKDRVSVNGIDAGILVFDYDAYQIIRYEPEVVVALADLNAERNVNNQRRAFLRLERNLRSEADRAYYALINLVKNLQP